MVIEDAVRGIYESRWGKPDREAKFRVQGNPMEIYKWSEGATGEGVAIYATNGAGAVLPQDLGYRVEFFIGFHPEFDDIAPALSLLGSYPLVGGKVAEGDTVTLGEPLWQGASVSTFLIVPQLERLLDPLPLPDSSHVHFCQTLPISESELKLKQEFGAEWLLGELNDRGIATWTHDRQYL